MTRSTLRVVFLDHDTIAPHIQLPDFTFEHELVAHGSTAASEVADRIALADIVITNKVPVQEAAIRKAQHLKLVAVAATGVDNVDLEACERAGVAVCNVTAYAKTSVSEHTIALMFALRRSLVGYRESVRQGRWQEAGQFSYFDYPVQDLAGSTLGIIGRGTLGQATAALASCLGMQVLFAGRKGVEQPPEPYTAFSDVLARSDIISLHCPLNEHTRGLIGLDEFHQMQRKPLLINTARGGLVCEQALITAMRTDLISGAGVDVTTPEPPPADHPLLELLDMPNFILTPHMGWASTEAMKIMAEQLTGNINAFVQGNPRNLVTPEARS